MKKETKRMIDHMLEVKFDCALKKDQINFIKSDKKGITLYDWKDGGAYVGQYRFLKKMYRDLDTMLDEIKEAFDVIDVEKESYFYRDEILVLPSLEKYEVHFLSVEDEKILKKMQEKCTKEELEVAQILIFDQDIVGAFYQEELVGVASVIELDSAFDIGVLVHPDYRRQGISTYLVNECANKIISKHKLCQYRCDDENIGSYHTALALSFEKRISVASIKIER